MHNRCIYPIPCSWWASSVTVVQGTSDEAKGLLAHVQRDLGAHHSPALFHLRQAVGHAMTLPLARAVAQAETDEATAETAWRGECAAKPAYDLRRHGPGRPPAFASGCALRARRPRLT